MRVAMVETGGWGGITHYAWHLCQALAEQGTEVHLLTNETYELAQLPRAFAVHACLSGATSYPRNAARVREQLRELSPKVVHVQSLLSTRFDVLLWPRIRQRVPLVFTVHNVRNHEPSIWASWTLWRCLRSADALIAHTTESAQEISRWLGPRIPVHVIHQGDYPFFVGSGVPDRRSARRQLGLPPDGKLILMFGAIRPYKGILEAIAVLPVIRSCHPDAHLVIAGPLMVGTEAEYREAIRTAEVGASVAFRPAYVSHEEVAAYFAAADVALYNYHDITDSASLRLACSLGVPVVATAVGAFREFLHDGVTARLVPPHSPESLAAAVSDLLANPDLAACLAEGARSLSAEVWSWAGSSRGTREVYEEICADSGSRPRVASGPVTGGATGHR
jgi:glycosyltransferase involved in cell wall biosynthesis